MTRTDATKIAVGVTLFALLTWVGFGMYTRPLAESRIADPIRDFLTAALAGDSASLDRLAADPQPARWAMAAIRADSAAVTEWARSRDGAKSVTRGDTLWVTVFRSWSTPECSYYSTLIGGLIGPRGRRQLVHLTGTCPEVTE